MFRGSVPRLHSDPDEASIVDPTSQLGRTRLDYNDPKQMSELMDYLIEVCNMKAKRAPEVMLKNLTDSGQILVLV